MFIKKMWQGYGFSIFLLISVICGGCLGWIFPSIGPILKPLGEIFLNLMFTVVIPLVFFSVSSVVGGHLSVLKNMIGRMIIVFSGLSILAALYMFGLANFFPLQAIHAATLSAVDSASSVLVPIDWANLFTVSDFGLLFSREHLLALIIFSVLLGSSVSLCGEKGKVFQRFLESGSHVSMQLVSCIMWYAPIGFFAYFSASIGEYGHAFLSAYKQIGILYYLAAFVYFGLVFSILALLTKKPLILFWKNMITPSVTALATCSSAASLPVSIESAQKMGVPKIIAQTVIPLGIMLHKQGSIMGGVLKILFLFTMFHMPLSFSASVSVLVMSILVGTAMGAIPSGGMLGEMLIISVFGFPPQALMWIAVISLLIDPPATLLNVTGNTVASLLLSAFSKKESKDISVEK